jgi:hypothetical protein
MFSRIGGRLTYTKVAVTFALVFAMSGGAFAAGKYLITSTKQIKPSVLKQLKGKTGPAGKEGPGGREGAKGANGINGANGEKGVPGTNGVNGNPGVNGKSVIGESESAGTANCGGVGGSSFHEEGSATKRYACNGKEGSPWTAGGTLPIGATEKGGWGGIASGFTMASISFTIPLAAAPTPHYVTVAQQSGHTVPAECKSGATEGSAANPLAASSNLCVYETTSVGTSGTPTIFSPDDAGTVGGHAGKTGALILVTGGSVVEAYGTWAVTG